MTPIYAFECPTCEVKRDEIMSISEYERHEPLPCPVCSEPMVRVIETTHGRVIGFNAQNGYSYG